MGQLDYHQFLSVFVVFAICVSVICLKGGESGNCNVYHWHYDLASAGHCVDVQMGQLDYQQLLSVFVVSATCASARCLKGGEFGNCNSHHLQYHLTQAGHCVEVQMGQLDYQQLLSVFVVFATCASVRFLKGGEFGNCISYHVHYHLTPAGHCVEVQMGQLDYQQLLSVFVVFVTCASVRFLKGAECGNCNIYHSHYHLTQTGHCVEVQMGQLDYQQILSVFMVFVICVSVRF